MNINLIGIISVALSLIGVILWIEWAVRNKEKWLYCIPPISWLVSTLVLWGIFFCSCDNAVLRIWGAVVMLQGIILVTSGVFMGLIGLKDSKTDAKKLAKVWEEKEL